MTENKQAEVVTAATGPASTDVSTWRGSIEIASKVIVAFIGLSYVIGLLILNLHVRKYGIYYLNFLQIEYVMVGILWLCLVTWVSCLFLAILHRCKQIFKTLKTKDVYIESFYLLVTFFVGYTSLWYVLMVLTGSGDEKAVTFSLDWKIVGALSIGAAGVFNLLNKLMDFRTYVRSKQAKTNQAYKFFQAFDTLYFLVLLVVGLSVYASYAFPKLSATFGGGKPQKAEFLIKTDRIDTVKAIGFQFAAENSKVGPLEVVFEASDFFLIKPPQGFANDNVKAIRLNKDLIDAAFYLASK